MIDFGYGVSLGPLDVEHAPKIRDWRNDRRIWKWCRQHDLISDLSQHAWFKAQSADPTIKMYMIYGEKGQAAGVCGFTSIDYLNRRAEFSLYIAPDFQEDGLGKKALKTLFGHGFLNLGFNSIWGETFDGNLAGPMFQRMGMKHEGTRRDFYFRNGRFIDAHLYSLLRAEWDKLPKGPRLCSTQDSPRE